MHIKTSVSVIIRIVLWFFLLIGGAFFSIKVDSHSTLFHSFLFHITSGIIGVIIIVFAFRAAGNGGKELTKGRVGNIPRLETNKLVTSGIYSCMRHPMLFGLALLPLGLGFLLGSPTFITFTAPLEILFIIIMVVIFEEMEVKKKFSQEYEQYKKEVPMISFEKKCLQKLFQAYKSTNS